MATKAEMMAEAYRRGILPPEKVALYEEAISRGLTEEKKETPGAMSRVADVASGANRALLGMLDLPGQALWGLAELGGRGVGAVGEAIHPKVGEFLRKPRFDVETQPFTRMGEAVGGIVDPTDQTSRVLQKVGEYGGAAAAPAGALGALGKAGVKTARPFINKMLHQAGQAPGRFLAGETAMGGLSGLGAGIAREIAPESGTAELVGALSPTGARLATSAALRGAMRGGQAGRQTTQQTLETFQRAGTSPTAGQATGRRWLQGLENISSKVFGGGKLAKRGQEINEELGKQVDTVVSRLAAGAEPETAGRGIRLGIQNFVRGFRHRSGQIYDKLDEFIPQDSPVPLSNTQKTLAEMTAPIEGAEEITSILSNPKIVQIAGAVKDKGVVPYTALKQLRSFVGRKLGSTDLVSDIPRAELKRLYGALTQDMQAAAQAAGPRAVQTLERANRYTRAGHQRIDDFLQSIANKTTPEEMYTAAVRGTKEGATRVRTVMRSLNNQQRKTVAATMIKRMGRATPGQQSDIGEAFSFNTFLTNWNKLHPGAKRAMFDSIKGLRRDMDAIASTSNTLREAAKVSQNLSGTAGAFTNTMLQVSPVAALFKPFLLPVAAGAVGVNASIAHLMTNPKFVGWLARSTNIPVAQIPGHITRLTRIAQNADEETREALQTYISSVTEGP